MFPFRVDLKRKYGLDVDKLRDFFDVKGIDARKSWSTDDSYSSWDNDGSSFHGERICSTRRRIVSPKMAKTRDKRWVYVVQDEDSQFRQTVIVENCA